MSTSTAVSDASSKKKEEAPLLANKPKKDDKSVLVSPTVSEDVDDDSKPPIPFGTKVLQIVEKWENPKKVDTKTCFVVISGVVTKYQKVSDSTEKKLLVEYEDGDESHFSVSEIEQLLSEAKDINQRLALLRQPLGEPPYKLGTSIQRIIHDTSEDLDVLIEGKLTSYETNVTPLGVDICFKADYDYGCQILHELLTVDEVKIRFEKMESGALKETLYAKGGIIDPEIRDVPEEDEASAGEKENYKEDSEAEIDEESDDDGVDDNSDEDYVESEEESDDDDDDDEDYMDEAGSSSKKRKRW